MNLGNIYRDLHEDDKAIIEYKMSIKIRDRDQSSVDAAMANMHSHESLAQIYKRNNVSP